MPPVSSHQFWMLCAENGRLRQTELADPRCGTVGGVCNPPGSCWLGKKWYMYSPKGEGRVLAIFGEPLAQPKKAYFPLFSAPAKAFIFPDPRGRGRSNLLLENKNQLLNYFLWKPASHCLRVGGSFTLELKVNLTTSWKKKKLSSFSEILGNSPAPSALGRSHSEKTTPN